MQTQQINQTQTTIPDYARPFVEELLGSTAALTDFGANPYMQYQGDRIAQFSPLQQMSYDNAALMQTSPQLRDATALAGKAGLGALNTQYTFRPTTNTFSAPGAYTAGTFNARDVASQNFVDSDAAKQYMSPFMQNVVDVQTQQARRQADINAQTQQAQAARAGAFGGARDYIARSQGNAELQRNLANIQATGSQNAFTQAQAQFNADQQRQLQAGMANQQAQAAAQQAAEQSRQFGSGQSMQAANLAAQYGMSANQLNAQQQQFGAGLGLQGLQTALQGAGQLGNLGQTQFKQGMDIMGLQNQFGGQQQQQAQNILNTQYQDFLNFQNYPYKQLGFMSDMLRGLPLTQQSSTIYGQAPSTTSQLVGLGTAALGASRLFAKGGEVKSRPAGLADLALSRMA